MAAGNVREGDCARVTMIDEMGDTSDEPDPPGQPTVDIIDSTGCLDRSQVEWLCARARDAMRELRATGEVRVRLVDDTEMAHIHERDTGVVGTTDVLTYDLGTSGRVLDVDVLACVCVARRQALGRGLRVQRELLLYIVHAMLHCVGHDDRDAGDFAAMHEAEDRLLGAIGVGATFAREMRH